MNKQSPKLKINWQFPLPDTHAGILMGNGLFGVSVWGDQQLCLTINRADFWDRREARGLTSRMNYADLRRFWTAGDQEGNQSDGPDIGPVGPDSCSYRPADGAHRIGAPRPECFPANGPGRSLRSGKRVPEAPLRLVVAADQPLLLIETDRTDLDIILQTSPGISR